MYNNQCLTNIDSSSVKEILADVSKIELYTKKGVLKAAGLSSKPKINKCGAKDTKIEYTNIGESFIRFSPYEDDIRIDREKNRVRPGTFATTVEDGEICLNEHLDIRERYALPSDKEIIYAFYITPLKNTEIQRGVVQPANGKKGGGEEVIFPSGTTDNTVGKIKKIR